MSAPFWPGCVRVKYHRIPDRIKEKAASKGVQIDSRSNGQGWHIDHIYNGKFPWFTKASSLHAVKNGDHFTQSAGLVAIHPLAEALKDEYFYSAWLLDLCAPISLAKVRF